ncbi:MAG: amidohydrolase [Myxococcales bacterium]|nr:amidohydrolase [Myxococcales bacterium]
MLLVILLLSLMPAVAHGQAAAGKVAATDATAELKSWVKGSLGDWVSLYQELHTSPELSLHEKKTAARLAAKLGEMGYEVTTGVGGHGLVALMKNGSGPTLLLRGDMDGLPVVEQTGLPYRSQVKVIGDRGVEVGVMHACGHDVHMTNLLASASFLASHRALWSGTLVVIGQPAEEVGRGAAMMMADGLFKRFPRPDYALALHVEPGLPAGQVGIVSGWAAANVDSVKITIHGRGGHGARPHQANDPVVTAAHLVTALQTLVSRRVDPQAAAVVTVGALHAGTKNNVIPDSAELLLTVRSYADDTRATLLDGIRQLAGDICRSFQCPKPPEVEVSKEYTPAVYNDPELSATAAGVFRRVLGEDAVAEIAPTMGGEDFGRYARRLKIPGLLFRLGAIEPKLMARSKKKGGPPLPSLHSSRFAPDARRALEAGIVATSSLVLQLLPPAQAQ